MKYFTPDFLDFFKELAANNHKEWFDINRKRYEKSVKEPFKQFVEDLMDKIYEDDSNILMDASKSIFRINRDIRFSKDKTPYKTQVSAIISPGGKKDKTYPGVYIQLSPEDIRFYGGVYMPDKDQLYTMRTYIANNLKQFNNILSEAKFKKHFGTVHGEQHKRIPKEFQAVFKQQALIANKGFYYFKKLKASNVKKDNLLEQLMELYYISKPMKDFFTKALNK